MKERFIDWLRLKHNFEEINRNFIERMDYLVPRSSG